GLAEGRYRNATNMTDRMAAMTVLAHRFQGSRAARAALADFEDRFDGDPIVLGTSVQVQASAPGERAVDTVRRRLGHRGFTHANPSRVRALVGTFASANQTGFHRKDGAGYRLFADTVLKVEQINPQVAARLATALRSWRSLEPERREHARETLVRIARDG